MRWFVTGSHGQLGTALRESLEARGEPFRAFDSTLDVADEEALAAALDEGPRPEVLLNAAAFTQVDRCEREPELAARVNAHAPGLLARLAHARGIRLVHVSTDYVFDGQGRRPCREDDPVAPRSVYGRTKLAGERAVGEAAPDALVVRTSWVFGAGRNFVAAILEQGRAAAEGRRGPLRVVDDQRGRPTSAWDLAEGLLALVERGATGLYHLANQGEATWWDVARAALDHAGLGAVPVDRVATADLDLAAPRPAWSVLDLARAEAAGVVLRPWREALAAHLDRTRHAEAAASPGRSARGAQAPSRGAEDDHG